MKLKACRNVISIIIIMLLIPFSAGSAQQMPCSPDWESIIYPNSTTAYGIVTVNGEPAGEGDLVGAFVGGECRAVESVRLNDGKAYVSLVINGTETETVAFKLWDVSECAETGIDLSVTSDPGATLGYFPDLLAMDARSSTGPPSDNWGTVVPASEIIYPGKAFFMDIRLSGTDIWAAQVELNPAPRFLEPVHQGIYAVENPFFPKPRFEINITLSDDGRWAGSNSLKHPETPVSGEGSFATRVKYKPVAGAYGETTLRGNVIMTNKNGDLLPASFIPATVIINDGIHVDEQGNLGNAIIEGVVTYSDGTPVSGAEVTISIGNKTYSVITDENGAYRFDDLIGLSEGEVYKIEAVKDTFRAEAEVDDVSSPVTLELSILNNLLADLNQDGNVDIADFTLLASSYGLSEGEDGFDARADINNDSAVTIQDLALLGSHWKI